MGTSSSTPQKTPEQQDLAFLGERFPYGDEELRHLYAAYQSLLLKRQQNTNNDTITLSFFQEWFVACAPPEQNNAQQHQKQSSRLLKPSSLTPEDRRVIMEMMEEHILGSSEIGNTLFQVACLLPGEPNWYRSTGTTNINTKQTHSETQPPTETDEFTRRAKLEQFMDGFSNMGRRGAKHALTALFNAVHASEQRTPKQQSQTSNQSQPIDHSMNSPEKTISAHLFMEWGYRLALANAFLEKVHALDMEQQRRSSIHNTNPTKLPSTPETENVDDEPGQGEEENEQVEIIARVSGLLKEFIPHLEHIDRDLKPMAQSLLEKTKSRLNRYGILTANKEWDDEDPSAVELTDCLEWSEAVAPLFATILPTCLFNVLFFGRPVPPTRTFFQFPNHQLQENTTDKGDEEVPVESILDSKAKAFALACASSSLMGPYFRLYTSAADGLSFNRILNALLGYSGPTLLLIQSTNGGEFGAFTSHAWKESKDFYGNSDCFLFQLHPQLSVFRPTGNGKNFMYCNSHARSKGYDQLAHGIGFGGTTDQPRLFLAENLMEDCQASTQDITFENGSLLPKLNQQQSSSSGTSTYLRKASSSTKAYFDIHSLEIWGVGGSDIVQAALDGRRKARELRDEGIRRARKVDKAQFLDDFRSGAIESKAFAYKQQIDGRADQDVDNRHSKGYDYEK